MVRTIISVILLVLVAICIGVLIYLIIKGKRLREERDLIYYLIETEFEDPDALD
jgi:hypothetical protein